MLYIINFIFSKLYNYFRRIFEMSFLFSKISALLQHGADIGIRNSEGKSALEVADSTTRPILTGKIKFIK